MKTLFATVALSLITSGTALAASSSGRTAARSPRQTSTRPAARPSSTRSARPKAVTPRSLERAWERLFIEKIDDDLTTTFPTQHVVQEIDLPVGSAVAVAYDRAVRKYGARQIDAFKDPKSGTLAVRESSDGESDFRLQVFNASGTTLIASASVADDATTRWTHVAPSGPMMRAPRTPSVGPRQSREPFRDIGGFAGPARTPAQPAPAPAPAQTAPAQSSGFDYRAARNYPGGIFAYINRHGNI